MSRIEFANSLRGIASGVVMLAHYIVVFGGGLQGAYAGFPALPSNPFPDWLFKTFTAIPIDFGVFGVGVFFLISGFVIPNSVASLARLPRGRIGFMVNRIFRLHPTYFVGLLVTTAAMNWAFRENAAGVQYITEHVLINASLFRDWDWTSTGPIGGVVWTLEAETKFYLFVLLFWGAISRGKLYPLYLIAAAAAVSAAYGNAYPTSWNLPDNFLWFFKYLLFMCIGIVFNLHIRKKIATEALMVHVMAMSTIFLYVCASTGISPLGSLSYFEALAVFTAMYFLAPAWKGGRVVRFLADISYPLYAVHASLGYIGMRVLIGEGVNAVAALGIMVAVSLFVAWLIHIAIERPTQWLSKHGGKWLASLTFGDVMGFVRRKMA